MVIPKMKKFLINFILALFLTFLSGCSPFRIIPTNELPVNIVFTYPENHATNLPTALAFVYQIYADIKNPQKIIIYLSEDKDLLYPNISSSKDVITIESTNLNPSGSSYPTEKVAFTTGIILEPGKQYFWRYKLIGDNWSFISKVKDFTTTSFSYKLDKEIDFYKVFSIGFISNNYLYVITDSSLVILDENLNEVLNTEKFLEYLSDVPYYSKDYMIVSDSDSIYKTTSEPSPEILWRYTINSVGNFKASVLGNNTIFILNNDIIVNDTSYATGILLNMDGNLIKQKTYKVNRSFVESVPSIIKETDDEIIAFSKDSNVFARFSKDTLDLISYKEFDSMLYGGNFFLIKSDTPALDDDPENDEIYKINYDGSIKKIIDRSFTDNKISGSFIHLDRCAEYHYDIICLGATSNYPYSSYSGYIIIAKIEGGRITDYDIIEFSENIDLMNDSSITITESGNVLITTRISPYEGMNYGVLLLKRRQANVITSPQK